jgi:hypothetical protein
MKLNKPAILIIIAVLLLISLILNWEDAKRGFIDGINSR